MGAGDRPVPVTGNLDIPANIIKHNAVLYSRDQKPFSEVAEVYADDLLAFPLPSPKN